MAERLNVGISGIASLSYISVTSIYEEPENLHYILIEGDSTAEVIDDIRGGGDYIETCIYTLKQKVITPSIHQHVMFIKPTIHSH